MKSESLWKDDYRPELVSGKLCLDFANSLEPWGGPRPYPLPPGFQVRDCLHTYGNLVAWGVYAGAVSELDAQRLAHEAERQPDEAAAVFRRAQTLRDVIYRVFWRVANRLAPDDDDLRLIAQEHHLATVQTVLVEEQGAFVWRWPTASLALDRVLWPIAQSAAELLVEGDQTRLKVCPGVPGDLVPCAWLFYDTSKSRTRQWCSMDDCGGITKMRRQNERRRAGRPPRSS